MTDRNQRSEVRNPGRPSDDELSAAFTVLHRWLRAHHPSPLARVAGNGVVIVVASGAAGSDLWSYVDEHTSESGRQVATIPNHLKKAQH